MQTGLQESIIENIKPVLVSLERTFGELLETGRSIENTLEEDSELLAELRRYFDNLSAAVELEFEGTSVFEQEIARTRTMIEKSLEWVRESSRITGNISEELQSIWQSFDMIHTQGVQLSDTINRISSVAESIEVASRNAGVTAYHSGREGRGFEVIAREMTALVRSVQNPAKIIPGISDDIIKDIVELSHQLLKIGNYISEFKAIDEKFGNIISSFMELIPEVESELKNILGSVETQRKLHHDLTLENEKSLQWRDELFRISRVHAISEMIFEASYRAIDIKKKALFDVEDNDNLTILFRSFQIALDDLINQYQLALEDKGTIEAVRSRTQAAERCVTMLVTEASALLRLVHETAGEVKKWLRTNDQAAQFVQQGIESYKKVSAIIIGIKDQVQQVSDTARGIDQPLCALRRITERSRLLGLYAGIESARSSSYAPALSLVTQEIKTLSDQSAAFVKTIGGISGEMADNFTDLAGIIRDTIADIASGIDALEGALAVLNDNREVLNNLDKLAGEMKESTEKINDYCVDINDLMQRLNGDYERIDRDLVRYNELVDENVASANKAREKSSFQDKDLGIISRTGQTLNYRQPIEPLMLDPAFKTDARSHEVIEQIFIGLMSFDSANHLIPGIAERFTVSGDGLKWDFTMRSNVRFHDGRTISVDDVAASFERVRQGPNAFFIDYVETIAALDNRRVRFTLRYPYLPFLANIACGVCDITKTEFDPERPIGAGPYRFIDWVKGERLDLEYWPEFVFGRVPVDRLAISFIADEKEASARFRAGEIDITPVTPESIGYYLEEELVKGATLSTQYLGINVRQDTPFNNVKVRQAMNHAIDKKFFVENLMKGQSIPANGVFPPGLYAYNPDLRPYDFSLEKARKLMREAGFGGGLPNVYKLDVRDSATSIQRAEYLQKCLANIGIEVSVNPMPWDQFLEHGYKGKSLLCIKSWVSDNGDPDNFVFPLFHSRSFGESGNTSFYGNPRIDEMIEMARSERSLKRRRLIYQEIERSVCNDAPWVFLSHGVDTYAVSPRIKGFSVDPFGINRFRYLWKN